MKIIFIDVNYRKSSTGKIVHALARKLISDGHSAKVLYGRGDKSGDEIGVRISSVFEVYFHALMTRLTGLTGFFSFFATRSIIRFIDKFKPDVVHLHELHGYYVNFGRLIRYLKSKNIPVIWTFHCEFAYTGKCGYAYECDNWKISCEKCPQLKNYPSSIYFDFTNPMHRWKKLDFQGFDNLIITTPSKWLADRVRQSFLKNHDIRVIYNGIDTDEIFRPLNSDDLRVKYGLLNKKVVLAVAPDIMSERKGGRWVLDLARNFDDSYRFIMVGVVAKIEELPSNVIAISKTENQIELAKFYSMADVLLLTSQKETFSLVVAESLACGTPVIGFDSGAPVEVAPTGYGHFVPYGRIDLLFKAVSNFFDGKLKMNDDFTCRKFANTNYDNRTMYENFLNIYHRSSK